MILKVLQWGKGAKFKTNERYVTSERPNKKWDLVFLNHLRNATIGQDVSCVNQAVKHLGSLLNLKQVIWMHFINAKYFFSFVQMGFL